MQRTLNKGGREMTVCYECAKEIKGQAVFTNPPIFLIKMGIDFPKAFHPKCYAKAEEKARLELKSA